MRTEKQLAVYGTLKFANQILFTVLILVGLGFGITYVLRSNEDVADYQSLTLQQTRVQAGGQVGYKFVWTKHVTASGNLYRSWLRMKNVDGKWVRDNRYVPVLVSGSFRVGRERGQHTNEPMVEAPKVPGFYVLQVRGEYERVFGAEPSVDVKESDNVLEVER
ncbi:hypothetical protein AB0H71_28825 [Nocardia sp. NPDC050697]|uniref:hypothetical protein n=1 Tax=Nocardia sp. NPDC050697 TaxID=3155158 RepID=UPI0033E432C5